MTVVRRRSATQDIDQIAGYIARSNVAAAERLLDAVAETFEILARFPDAGARARTPRARAAGVRQIMVRRQKFYIVYYLVGDDVQILRVMHTGRDRDVILETER